MYMGMSMKYFYNFFSISLVILFFTGCANLFLIKNLSKRDKARSLITKGAYLYRVQLESKQKFEKIPEIRKFFLKALDFDENNKTAIAYIKKVNSFKRIHANKNYRTALKYKNKSRRKTQDDFNMCYFIQKALEIDPKFKEAKKLKKSVKSTYKKLINNYLKIGNKIKIDLSKTKNYGSQTKLYLKALDNYGRALLLDPSHGEVKKQKYFYEKEMDKRITHYLNLSKKALAKKERDFFTIKYYIRELYKYDQIVENNYYKAIRQIQYELYYYWAYDAYQDKKYKLANSRIERALEIKNTRPAKNLQNNIQIKKTQARVSKSFEATLASIDESLEADELGEAINEINLLLKSIKDPSQRAQVNKRKKQFNNKIPALYEDAIESFNEENFSKSIKKLKVVKSFKPNYKDTEIYLKKAIAAQKALDEF